MQEDITQVSQLRQTNFISEVVRKSVILLSQKKKNSFSSLGHVKGFSQDIPIEPVSDRVNAGRGTHFFTHDPKQKKIQRF